MSYTVSIEQPTVDQQPNVSSLESVDQPSTVELFSYGVCCVAQGLVGMLYFALVVILPVAASRGLFSHLL
jgi:hypothetical protein